MLLLSKKTGDVFDFAIYAKALKGLKLPVGNMRVLSRHPDSQ
jgi:hypothetical protein